MKRKLLLALVLQTMLFGIITMRAQENKEFGIIINTESVSNAPELIRKIEESSSLRIHFSPGHINYKADLIITEKNLTVSEVIQRIAGNHKLDVVVNGSDVYLIRNLSRQQKKSSDISISGYIRDIDTGEALEGAAIYTKNLHSGQLADYRGYFNFKIPSEADTLIISYIGYQPITLERNNFGSGILGDIYLKSSLLLREIVITDNIPVATTRIPDFQRHKTSTTMQGNTAKLGVHDVFSELIIKPGVQRINDFQGGLSVNGSSPGTNIYYLDGIRIFEPNHIYGLFSSFSSKPVSSVTMHNNYIPQNYSGAFTSVLDFHTRDGNFRKTETEAGLSNSTAHIFITGPLKKYKTSYFIDYRHSLFGAYLPALIKKYKELEFERISFNDLHAKITHRINPANRISVFYYQGNDHIGILSSLDEKTTSENEFKWANSAGGMQWHILAGDNFKSDLSISLAGYRNNSYSAFRIPDGNKVDRFLNIYSSTDNSEYSLRHNLSFYNKRSVIKAGYQLTRYSVSPVLGGVISTTEKEKINFESDRDSILSNAMAYISLQFKPNHLLKLQAGLQAGFLHNMIFTNKYLNPQISISLMPADKIYFDLAYNRTNMFLHSLGSYAAGIPSMIWVLSGNEIPVSYSDAISMNAIHTRKWITIRGEIYYRLMHKILFYKNIIDSYNPIATRNAFIPVIFDSDRPEKNIETGKGRAYGVNLMTKIRLKKLSSAISFSSNRTMEKYKALNNGEWFSGKYDLSYSAGLSLAYNFNDEIRLFMDINTHSGQLLTMPLHSYTGLDGEEILDFSNIHNIRIGRYQSVDIGGYYSKMRDKYRWKFSFGITNVFNHFNPAYAYIYKENNVYKASKVAGLPIVPFVAAEIVF